MLWKQRLKIGLPPQASTLASTCSSHRQSRARHKRLRHGDVLGLDFSFTVRNQDSGYSHRQSEAQRRTHRGLASAGRRPYTHRHIAKNKTSRSWVKTLTAEQVRQYGSIWQKAKTCQSRWTRSRVKTHMLQIARHVNLENTHRRVGSSN